jgi:hypothetical protein
MYTPEQYKVYYLRTKEYQKKRKALYYQENRERFIDERKKYYIENHNKVNECNRKWDKKNPEKRLGYELNRMKKIGKVFEKTESETMYLIKYWSKTVKKRDNNKCTWCNSTKTLVSHHIWHKAFCPESALDIDNGITLCHDCHMEQHRLDRL